MSLKSGPNSPTVLVDGFRISIDYMSDSQYDHVCIFTVSGEDTASVYLSPLTKQEAHMSRRILVRHLLERLASATFVRSFTLAAES
jgi:hypothetical protein